MEVSAGSQLTDSSGGPTPWGVELLGFPQLCSTPDGASERGDAGGEMATPAGCRGSDLGMGFRREQGVNSTGLWLLSN